MIDKSQSRIGIFGASETSLIMTDCKSLTYQKFLKQKAGIIEREELNNKYIFAGNVLEHQIIDFLNIEDIEKDKQIHLKKLNLRINLDANTDDCVYEIKTRNKKYFFTDFKPPKNYLEQTLVQMFGMRKIMKNDDIQGKIVILYLDDDDYDNLLEFKIKEENIKIFDIEYDEIFIKNYLKKLKLANVHLANLMKGV